MIAAFKSCQHSKTAWHMWIIFFMFVIVKTRFVGQNIFGNSNRKSRKFVKKCVMISEIWTRYLCTRIINEFPRFSFNTLRANVIITYPYGRHITITFISLYLVNWGALYDYLLAWFEVSLYFYLFFFNSEEKRSCHRSSKSINCATSNLTF